MNEVHTLNIENQKKIKLSAVAEVNGFSDKEIRVTLANGVKISVGGTDMKITHFQKESGEFVADGKIIAVKYHGAGQNFFKRLVK